MRNCVVCEEISSYECTFCKQFLCKVHRIEHHQIQAEHKLEKIRTKLTAQNTKRLKKNLLSKILATKQCTNQIIQETECLIDRIQSMCIHAVNQIQAKEQHYLNLLKISQKPLLTQKIKEIRKELKISIEIFMPKYRFEEIEKFYKTPYLSEFETITKLNLLPPSAALELLSEEYDLFIRAHTKKVNSVVITNDSKYIISASEDKTLIIWNLHERRQETALLDQKKPIFNVTLSDDDNYILTGSLHKIGLWNLRKKKLKAFFRDYTGKNHGIVRKNESKNIYYYYSYCDKAIRVWDIKKKIIEFSLQYPYRFESNLAISSDNKWIVSGCIDGSIVIFSLESSYLITLYGHTKGVIKLLITNDDKYIISASHDKTIRIWDLDEKTQVAIFEGHTRSVGCITATNSYKYIVSGSNDATIRIWDFQHKMIEAILKGHTNNVTSVLLTRDGKYIISAAGNTSETTPDYTIRIWNFIEKRAEAVLCGHTAPINCIAVTSDSKYIVSGSTDRTVRVWDLIEKTEVSMANGHHRKITRVEASSDMKYVYSVSQDKTIRIWNVREKIQETLIITHCDYIRNVKLANNNRYIVYCSRQNHYWICKTKIA